MLLSGGMRCMSEGHKRNALSLRDSVRLAFTAALAAGFLAACTSSLQGHTPASPTATAESPASSGIPFPEGMLIANGQVELHPVVDSAELAKDVQSFSSAEIDSHDNHGNLQTAKSGSESGFVLVGSLDVTGDGNLEVGTFGYVTSAGGQEHIAQKISDNRWIVLS